MNSSMEEKNLIDDSPGLSQTSVRTTLTQHDPHAEQSRPKAKHISKVSRRLLGYAIRHKGLLILGNLAMIASTGGMIYLPLISGKIIDQMNKKEEEGSIISFFSLFAVLGCLMAMFSAVRGYSFNLLGEKIVLDMRRQLFKSLVEKDISYYDRTKTGALISRLTSDIGVVESAATDNLTILIRNLLQFGGSLLFLFYLSWKLTTFILMVVPFIAIFVIVIIKKLKKYRKEYQTSLAYANSLASEVLGNIRVVRSFSNQNNQYRNYQELLKKTYQTGRIRSMLYAGMLFAIILCANFLVLSVLYLGQQMSVGHLTSFVLYTITLTTGLTSVSELINQVVSAMGVCEGIFQIIDQPIEVLNGTLKPKLDHSQIIVEFKNATFSYPTKESVNVIQELNLKIRRGESVALVGSSGSGKSSIVNLILRFYDLNEGSLQISGTDIKRLDINDLRKAIGFVSQEPTLFSGSLRENIEYGLKDNEKSESKINTALQIANASQFVMNKDTFPQTLDTLVGERGTKLSGGQKQRIAIARSVIKNPSLLIFDQATSALDAENQSKVQQAIDKLINEREKSKTMIIVAHRLSTIKNCDRIIVLQNGNIAEQGTPTELYSRRGIYYNLVRKQVSAHNQLL